MNRPALTIGALALAAALSACTLGHGPAPSATTGTTMPPTQAESTVPSESPSPTPSPSAATPTAAPTVKPTAVPSSFDPQNPVDPLHRGSASPRR
jgi:hypothetical protein